MPHHILTDFKNLVIVVTGCDTGFGAEIVNDLNQHDNYTIYATCLTLQAVEKYQAKGSTRLRAIQVDVTRQEDVSRLRDRIEAECPQGVYCVLNNAGINVGGLFDLTTEDAFELAGRINIPGLGSYSASKHAAESILDTLRVELSPWEIDISMIEPYFAKTPIMTNSHAAFEQNWKRAGDNVHAMYGEAFVETARKRSQLLYEKAMPPQWIVQAAVNAIREKNGAQTPRILVAPWHVRLLIWISEMTPEWVIDGMMRSSMKKGGSWPADPFLLKDGKHN
ncbi:hypothetical protein BGZ88_001021 [Linnemannia elongata]|nr:hypothetical protein BGZ88_001021 [Linnemannia elongata]